MISGKHVIYLLLFLFFAPELKSQNILNIPVSGYYPDMSLFEFLEILETRYGATFRYDPRKLPYYQQTHTFDSIPLHEALTEFLDGSNLDMIKYQDVIVLANKLFVTRNYLEDLIRKWDDGTFTKPVSEEPISIYLYFGDSTVAKAETVSFTGKILDKYSSEPIVGAIIQNLETGLGTSTDETGYFELEDSPGLHHYSISYLGYQPIDLTLDWYASSTQNIEMQVRTLNLSEVVVEATSVQDKVGDATIGFEAISMREVRELPSFLGEADIFRSIEQLPGVTTASEVSGGFNVRGGNVDQNLILLDDGILYNASHALGFFSVFNTDAVRNVSLYKGSIPAQYGGRLSSVLQVELKDGNDQKWHGSGGISPVSARLVVDGPIGENTTLLAGIRSSYSNWILRLAKDLRVRNSRSYFGDAVARLTHKLSDLHTLSASYYLSEDVFQFGSEFGYSWSSQLLNLKWRYLINNSLSLSTSFGLGYYDSNQFIPEGEGAFDLENGIRYYKGRSNLSFQNENHFVNAGIDAIFQEMDPEHFGPRNNHSQIRETEIEKDRGIEMSLYANDEWKIHPQVSIAGGLRFSTYVALGPGELRIYEEDQPRSPATVIENRTIGKNESMASYFALEPRVSVNWQFAAHQSLKLSYNHLRQYIHLMSNTASPSPVDVWQLSNAYIKPQRANNYSAGYFIQVNEEWDFSVEGFYKGMVDLLQFKDLATLISNPTIETELLSGPGRAYGAEFSATRNLGRWTGRFAYTYSRSQARTEGEHPEEIINSNDWYYANFDQPHQINFSIKHQVNPTQSFQFAFTYRSGRPVTIPSSNYELQGILITHYSDRNLYRIPAYHRLDFAYTLDRREAQIKGFRSSFTLSLYNLYFRENAFSVYFRRDSDGVQQAYQLSVLGRLFPSLTWNFTF